jgi:hypothetical protein
MKHLKMDRELLGMIFAIRMDGKTQPPEDYLLTLQVKPLATLLYQEL